MKTCLVCLAVALTLMLGLKTLAADALTGAQAVDQAFTKAMAANDINAVVECYASDAVLMIAGAPIAKGRDAIREHLKDFLSKFTVMSVTMTDTRYETSGDLSAAWGTVTFIVKPKSGGNQATQVSHFTEIAKKIDGRWVYIVDHASTHPAAGPQSKP